MYMFFHDQMQIFFSSSFLFTLSFLKALRLLVTWVTEHGEKPFSIIIPEGINLFNIKLNIKLSSYD